MRSTVAPARLVVALVLLAVSMVACAAPGTGPRAVRYFDAAEKRALAFDEVVERLVDADVIVLGELHDSGPGHEAQLALTRAILERRGSGAIALEQFERDVQDLVDAYLAGRIDRRGLDAARPWSNHDEHYHGALELARELGVPVLAANAPRHRATHVGRRGAGAVGASLYDPRWTDLDDPEYRERFFAALGGGAGHGSGKGMDPATLERYFAAQVLRDESMAETIVDEIRRRGADARPIVLWCGRFHSDYGLGTVSRIRARRADLDVRVVSMVRRDERDALLRESPLPAPLWIEVP